MNARNNDGVTRRLALSAITLVLSLLLSPVTQASANPEAFHMVAIENLAQGKLVTRGEYREAISRLEPSLARRSAFEKANNLCVAYTKSQILDKAADFCNAAVNVVGADNSSARKTYARDSERRSRDQAIALSNRGVLKAVTGNRKGALEDFELALQLYDELDEFHINLAYVAVFEAADNATAQVAR
ncbi:MAG: hypothetical protein WBM54_00710 [Woeseia sp.]